MKIELTPKELADLVKEIQGQPDDTSSFAQDFAEAIRDMTRELSS